MSTAAHTPGPWEREGQTIYALTHAGWRKGVEQFKNRFHVHIQSDREISDEEHEANILLIAAAPELLAVAMMAKEFEQHAGGTHLPASAWFELHEALNAAIAKATGAA